MQRNAISPKERARILSEIKKAPYVKVPKVYGIASQDFLEVVLELDPALVYPSIKELKAAYLKQIYTPLSELIKFEDVPVNETSILRYSSGSTGIGLHRDRIIYRNVIGIFVLEGEAPFEVYRNNVPTDLNLSPGDLVLLRAPREKRLPRPSHSVKSVKSQRISLTFRAKKDLN